MTAHEPVQGLPYPEPVDPPDGPNQMAALTMAAANRLVMRFASVAARDEALPAPVDGMECWTGTGTTARRWYRVAGAWVEATPQGAWMPYTPEITGPSTVTYGINATRTGRWVRLGRLIMGNALIRFGSGAAWGSGGDWFIPLPVAASGAQLLGTAWMFDGDAVNYVGAYQGLGSTNAVIRPHGANFTTNRDRPFAWAATDTIAVQYTYEPAA